MPKTITCLFPGERVDFFYHLNKPNVGEQWYSELSLTRLYRAEVGKVRVEARAMYDQQLGTLKAIHEEIIQQRPAILAEVELHLKDICQASQVTVVEADSSSMIPVTAIRSLEEIPIQHTSMDLRQYRSSQGTRLSEDNIKINGKEAPVFSQSSRSLQQKRRMYQDADGSDEGSQFIDLSLQQEPTMSLQVVHGLKSQCRRPCSCQCHRSSKLKTPDFLRQVTGQLLVGYAGISSFTPPCNEYACAERQKKAIRIQYHFPLWSFIQRMLTVVSCSGGAYGPEKILRMSRVRPDLDEVFIQVQSGNVSRLQQLFMQGDASPLDASDTGWNLLHYALTAGQLPTAKFLKDAGADLRAESASRQTPADIAWNRILSGCLDHQSEALLRIVFNDDAQLDERQFTTLHKIILGMLGKTLADELEVTTAYINARDSSGNTPLAWASARGDHQSVSLLLKHGASLDIANDVHEKPIHLAAQTGNIDTIRILVQAGAEINSKVRQTQMTPIHYAAEYQNNDDHIHGLADLGADIDGNDYLGWTPLHWASWRGHLASLDALLECGADVNAKTLDGNAPIMLAVSNNSRECVTQLIKIGADCSVVRDSQWNILHYAAIGGSLDTLRALSKADLSACNVEELRTNDTGQNVAEMLSARLEALEEDPVKREAWKGAWDALMPDPELGLPPPFVRSDTDSVYVDADDKPFMQRREE